MSKSPTYRLLTLNFYLLEENLGLPQYADVIHVFSTTYRVPIEVLNMTRTTDNRKVLRN